MASYHKMLVLTLSCALACGALAGNFQWDTSEHEGFINVGTSWSGGNAPGIGDNIVSTLSSGDYVVKFPSGDYEPCFREIQFLLTGATSVTIDGRGGTFTMPSTNSWNAGIPISFRTQTSGGLIFDVEDANNPRTLSWTNAWFKVTRSSANIADADITFDWYGGDFFAEDFNQGARLGVPAAKNYTYRFHNGFLDMPLMYLECNASSPSGALYETVGATVQASHIWFPGTIRKVSQYSPTNRVHATSGGIFKTVKAASRMGYSYNGTVYTTTDTVLMFEADNGGTVSLHSTSHTDPCTVFYYIHDNGTLAFTVGSSRTPIWSNADGANTVVRISDSTFTMKGYIHFGSAYTGTVDFRAERSSIKASESQWFQDGEYFLSDCEFQHDAPHEASKQFAIGGSSANNITGCRASMVAVDSTFTCPTFAIGNYGGDGRLVATGGVFTCARVELAANTASTYGRLELCNGAKLVVRDWLSGGAGTSEFFSDGGVFKASTASSTIKTLGKAEIRAGGLAIDNSGYNISIPQNFEPAAGVAGRIFLRGTGRTTLTGNMNGMALVAEEGTVDISDASNASFVSTNGAALAVTPGTPFAISGSATFAKAKFAFDVPVESGLTYELFSTGTALSQKSRDEIRGAAIRSNLGAALAGDFTFADNGSGGTLVKVTIREPQTTAISLTEGTSIDTQDRTISETDAFAVEVSSGAKLTLSGRHGYGSLTKTGGGVLTLTSADNRFDSGINIEGGLLEANDVDAVDSTFITLKAGTFAVSNSLPQEKKHSGALYFATAEANDFIAIRADGDVAFNAPSVDKGILVKYGKGSLAFDTESSTVLSKSGGTLPPDNPDTSARSVNGGDFVPTGLFGGLNIVEGELQLRATSPDVKYTIAPQILVGVNATDEGLVAQPRLTVANARIESVLSSTFLFVGGGIPSGSFVSSPSLHLTNAYVDVTSMRVGESSSRPGLNSLVRAVDSTLHSRWAMELGGCTGANSTSRWEFVNSRLQSRNNYEVDVTLSKTTVLLDFDNSVMGKDDGNGVSGNIRLQNSGQSRIDATFRNNSDFRVAYIDALTTLDTGIRHRFAFDGSSWTPSTGNATLATHIYGAGCLDLVATGAGMRLAPQGGYTWTLCHPVSGDGAIVKDGAGTLAIDVAKQWTDSGHTVLGTQSSPAVVKCAKGVRIQSGTVTVASGAAPAGTRFSGSGTLSGALVEPVFGYDEDARLTLSDCSISGRARIDFGGTAEAPFDWQAAAGSAVLSYSGTAPDVTGWKAVGIGEWGVSGKFTAENGKVRVSFHRRGFILNFL